MPKMKTSSAAKKRFKLTAAGKLMRRPAFAVHHLERKTAKRRRGKRRDDELVQADRHEALRMLGKR